MNTKRVSLFGFGFFFLMAPACFGQLQIPDGTRIRVRLEQTLSSATAEVGQTVQLSVTEPVKVEDTVVIEQGASVTGAVVLAQPKRRLGRTGKLDFSAERVTAVDGASIPLRYAITKKEGGSHAVRTGLIAAGVSVLFWPAAPFFLLMKGKDVTIQQGTIFELFTDQVHTLAKPADPVSAQVAGSPSTPINMTTANITSEPPGAGIELNGSFVGNTPSIIEVGEGEHIITIKKSGFKTWEQKLKTFSGQVNIIAELELSPEETQP